MLRFLHWFSMFPERYSHQWIVTTFFWYACVHVDICTCVHMHMEVIGWYLLSSITPHFFYYLFPFSSIITLSFETLNLELLTDWVVCSAISRDLPVLMRPSQALALQMHLTTLSFCVNTTNLNWGWHSCEEGPLVYKPFLWTHNWCLLLPLLLWNIVFLVFFSDRFFFRI